LGEGLHRDDPTIVVEVGIPPLRVGMTNTRSPPGS
jgi:hypothetical protein